MNVKKAGDLKGLGEIAEAAYCSGARMEATVHGFIVSRPGSPNETLRREIQDKRDKSGCNAGQALWKKAWGCGEEMDGGIHVMTAR